MPLNGFMGKLLKVNITDGSYTTFSSAEYTDRFLGGRGLAAKLYWELVPPSAGAFAPENCLICVNGPASGFHGIGSNRWQICTRALIGEHETFSYANFGGKWGAMLKYAGFDGLIVHGKAGTPVYIVIQDDTIEIKDASHLWGKTTFETCDLLKAEHGAGISILTIGQAAENLVAFASLLTDDGASGSGGLGSVMGSKNLKAIIVSGTKRPLAAHPQALRNLVVRVNKMREVPFAHAKPWDIPGVTKVKNCYGCSLGCSRHSYTLGAKDYKSFCQAAVVYMHSEGDHFGGIGANQQLATRLCDMYGIDTSVVMGLISWLIDCFREGILSEEETGLPLKRAGSADFIQTLTHKLAYREGFGELLAYGPLPAAKKLGEKATALLNFYVSTPAGETKDYDPRLIPATALLYATEPRRPIQQLHELSIILKMWLKWARKDEDSFFSSDDFWQVAETFLGGRVAADFTTYEGKALSAKIIQDRAYAKESIILCDFIWPMKWTLYPGGHVGDPTLESQIISAITGADIDTAELNRIGEAIFNLQRAISLRQGWQGRADDKLLDYYYNEPLKEGEIFFSKNCEVMGPEGKPVSKLGNMLDFATVEQLKDEYYQLRGWDKASGLPLKSTLVALGLSDIASDLAKRNLVK